VTRKGCGIANPPLARTSGKPRTARTGGGAYFAFHLAGRALRDVDVPIRVLLHGDVWFAPEDIDQLTAAFELALSKLQLSDRRDPLAVVLAKFIIELAKEGERDPEALCEGALSLLRK
jgi:hypothetical protein